MKKRRRFSLLRKLLIIFLILLLIPVATLWWAWKVEPYDVQTVQTSFELPAWKSAQQLPALRIVIAGDFHLRPGGDDLAQLYMERIMAAKPDMIFLLGDYANGHTQESSMSPAEARRHFSVLRAPLGIFAVPGNHDEYYGLQEWMNMLDGLDIHVMSNDTHLLPLPDGRQLQISALRDDYNVRVTPQEIPERISPDIPHILLSHVPDIFPILPPGRADIVICGHTHGGQICLPGGIPLANISREKVSFTYPWSRLNGTPFLITKGLGCSVLPLRFCCPPEIIVLELR